MPLEPGDTKTAPRLSRSPVRLFLLHADSFCGQCCERFHCAFNKRVAMSAVTTPTTAYSAMTIQKLHTSSCRVKNTEPREYGARTFPALTPARVCQAHNTGSSDQSARPNQSSTAPTNLREAFWRCIRLTAYRQSHARFISPAELVAEAIQSLPSKPSSKQSSSNWELEPNQS